MKWIGRLQCQQLLCLIGKLELLPLLCLYFGAECASGTCLSKWNGSRGSRRNIKKKERVPPREKMEGVSSVICVGPENTSGTWHSRIFFPRQLIFFFLLKKKKENCFIVLISSCKTCEIGPFLGKFIIFFECDDYENWIRWMSFNE